MVELLAPGTPSLYERSEEVSYEDAIPIIDKLMDIIRNVTWGHCVGMAAPQIGINKRVFIARGKAYINPVITHRTVDGIPHYEGCYSIAPNASHRVLRNESVKITYQDELGNEQNEWLSGFTAQVVQHEYDHLEGKVIGHE